MRKPALIAVASVAAVAATVVVAPHVMAAVTAQSVSCPGTVDDSDPATYTVTTSCTFPKAPPVTVTATVTATATETVTVTPTPTPDPTPSDPPSADPTPTDPPAVEQGTHRIGLSTSAANWSTEFNRLNANGGITVRRIFISTLSQGGNDSRSLIVDALQHGLIPWVSFKVPSPASPDQYQSWVATTAKQWEALSQQYGLPFYATIHHEPQDDTSGATFVAEQRSLAPVLAANCPDCKVGPILQSWQLDNPANDAADFDAYVATDLFADGTYSFFGFDSYVTPADRLPLVEARLHGLGLDDVPLAVGEWNSQDANQIAAAVGFLDDPRVEVASFWDSGQWYPLTQSREDAFESILADPRVQH